MIILRIPPLSSRQDLRLNLPILPPLLRNPRRDILRDALLLLIMIEDATPVLATSIGTLPIRGRGIVHLVEILD